MTDETLDRRRLITAAGALGLMSATAKAQTTAPEGLPTATTFGKALIGGKVIPYRVEAGERVLRNAAGEGRATIFAVSYLREGADPAKRAVTFVFNGGPGGSTWPLRDALGCKMIVKSDTAPGFAFANNPDSPFDVTDLVFIDAPGTGYSRFIVDAAKSEYWGIEQDASGVAQFIAGWLAAHGRQRSPAFLLGESYGGTRAGHVAELLAERRDSINLLGVVLVSPALGSGTDDLWMGLGSPAVFSLPSQAATAHWHGKGAYLDRRVQDVAAEAKRFAEGSYASILVNSASVSAEYRASIADQVSKFIGVPASIVLSENLTVSDVRFRDLLLSDQGERLSGEDGRKHHPKPTSGFESVIQTAVGYDLNAAIISFLVDALRYKPVGPYLRDPNEAHKAWNNTVTKGPKLISEIFKKIAFENAHFNIFLIGGYYDLIVPYSLPKMVFTSARIPSRQLQQKIYETGHAVYADQAVRPLSSEDLRAFYTITLG